MPFDPNVPQPGDDLDADVVRHQFTGLKDLIDSILPAPPVTQPKVFRARLSQTGSADPTLQVIANELGVNPTASRDSAGTYFINLPGAFAGMSYGNVVARPVAYMNTIAHEPRFLYVAAESDDALLVVQYQADGTPVDGMASNGSGILIEALVYG